MSEPTYTISADGTAITCHRCGLTSHHPMDVQHRYCGACHMFHAAAAARVPDAHPPAADLIKENAALRARLESCMHTGDMAHARAAILEAQIGGWEAACAAQVAAIRRALPYLERYHDSQADMVIEDLTIAIDTNVGETLLRQLMRAEAVAVAARIVLYEIDSIGAIQPHTRSMLQAGLDAFDAGKAKSE